MQFRKVIVAFSHESRLPDKRLDIPRRGNPGDLVQPLLSPDERAAYIGVKDSTGNAWID